jgi:tRNA (guanine37-N1)-methyltransferase
VSDEGDTPLPPRPRGERVRLSTYGDGASLETVPDDPGAPAGDRMTVSTDADAPDASGDAPARSLRREAPTRSHGAKRAVPSATPRALDEDTPMSAGFCARVLTLFPDMFPGPLGGSLTGKALKDRIWSLEPIDIRAFATDKHRSVDGPPAGGGPGLVMKPDVLDRAFNFAARGTPSDRALWPVIYLSPRGRRFDQAMARRLSAAQGVTLLCGRFEGVDERILEARGVEEVSLGDFVLTGGEIAALALLDATVRLIPRVIGNAGSLEEESFSSGLLEHPQYTKPVDWEGRAIPEVLLSGHHGNVAAWRRAQSERLTKERRPDLWRAHATGMTDPNEAAELSDAQTNRRNRRDKKDD